MKKLLCLIAIFSLLTNIITAQINISAGQTIIQNFDGIGTSATATLPTGWRADVQRVPRANGSYANASTQTTRIGAANMSSSAPSGIYNFGAGTTSTGNSDRSVGGLTDSAGAETVNVYLGLTNSGSTTISKLIISFDVEKYRQGTGSSGYGIELFYTNDDLVWQPIFSSNFKATFPADSTNNGYDTVPGEQQSIAPQTLPVNIAPGSTLYLSWSCSVLDGGTPSASAQALGIDNVVITALDGSTTSPSLTASPLSSFGNVCVNNSSTVNSFTLIGTNLDGSTISVGPLPGYTFSTSPTGPFLITMSPSYSDSTLNTTIYTQFTPTTAQSYNGSIPISGGGVINQIYVTVIGAGVNSVPPAVTTGSASAITSSNVTLTGSITDSGCSSISAYGIEYSTVNGFTNGSGVAVSGSGLSNGNFISSVAGLSPNTVYYYHSYATNSGGTSYGSQQLFLTSTANTSAPLNVVAINATDTTSTSFIANWNSTPGAVNYYLDVSTSKNFLDSNAAATLVSWTFPDSSDDSVVDVANNMNAGNVVTVVGTNVPTFNVLGATTNAARATGWTNGIGTKYWQIEVNTTSQYNLLLSSKQRSSATGPRDFKIQYKIVASGTWTDIPGATLMTADDFTTGVITNVALPDVCSNQPAVFVRWIMNSNTAVNGSTVGSSGSDLIDDITITGNQGSFVTGYKGLLVTDTSISVTGLSHSTTYYYRVRAFDGNTIGPNSNVITVITLATDTTSKPDTTTTPPPLEVVAIAATDTTSTSFAANWHPTQGAVSYQVDVSTTDDFVDIPITTTLENWTFPDSSDDATVDAANNVNIGQTISAVGTSSPTFDVAGATTNAARATSWASGSGTKYWQIEVNTTGQQNLLLSSKQRSSSTGPRDFKIQYRIGASGTWTDIPSATLTAADDFTTGLVANLSLPAECNNQPSVFIRWIMNSNVPVSGSDISSAGASLIDDILITGSQTTYVPGYKDTVVNDTSLVVTGLSPNTTYYYRVRAFDGTNTSPNSNIITVITLPAPVLPTTLLSFSGVGQTDKNLLQWTTATENNNRGFDLQRSMDSVNYQSISFINSSAPGGNSIGQINYSFYDYDITGDKQFYRLNQVDLDGQTDLSDTVLIQNSITGTTITANLYPNPATGIINLFINVPVQQTISYSITDSKGCRIKQGTYDLNAGNNTFSIDIKDLSSGFYYFRCTNIAGTIFIRKFVVH